MEQHTNTVQIFKKGNQNEIVQNLTKTISKQKIIQPKKIK